MKQSVSAFLAFAAGVVLTATLLLPLPTPAQSTSSSDQWIHVRVESKDDGGETVRVNVPVEMAVKVLPAIQNQHLRDGKIQICAHHLNDVDLRTMLDAVRSSKDGEYVTVQSGQDDVRIAKNAGYLYIHVVEKNRAAESDQDAEGKKMHGKAASPKESKVEVKVPMKVVDALLSSGKDELDLVAALHALSSSGETELVRVKDDENTVRVWIDSKNVSD
jgi:hypothetical protein